MRRNTTPDPRNGQGRPIAKRNTLPVAASSPLLAPELARLQESLVRAVMVAAERHYQERVRALMVQMAVWR